MLAFQDIRVLDFTHVLAGPFASYQLALGGAEVIKIEAPEGGDMVRPAGGPEEARRAGLGYAYLAQNANKKSVVLDLAQEEDRLTARALARGADVVLENFRTGVLDRLDLGYDVVADENPAIIYCSMTGFGPDGSYGQDGAYDNVIQAVSGLMALTGDADGNPRMVGAPLLDYGTGYAAAFAVASALLRRARTGCGQRIDLSMTDVALSMMSALTMRALNGEAVPVRDGNISANAGYGCYDASDGRVMIGAYSIAQSVRLWRLLGEDAEADATAALTLDRLPERHEIQKRLLTRAIAGGTVNHWVSLLQQGGVPAGPVQTLEQAVSGTYSAGRPILNASPVAIPGSGSVRIPGPAFRCDADTPTVRTAPPALGADTERVRAALRNGDGWETARVWGTCEDT
jgi:crotonobetainyl-CoA:carnitine CoA-transferase CaiB-like acyl-CoA transferase